MAVVKAFDRRALRLLCVAALSLSAAACSGKQGDLYDYISGKPSTPTSTPTASTATASTASGMPPSNAIAPDLAQSDDAKPIAELYNKALENLNEGAYKTAAKNFAEVERQHPYSSWATRAILMQAYAQYMRNEYDDAISAAQRFITLHPGHKDTAYAYYLVAMCYYEQIRDIQRDQSTTQKALDALDEVARRFPGTPYAQDAEQKALLARDHLAGKELEVGRYYMRKKAYLAAINRFKTVIVQYQTTSQTPEALYRLTEAYLALGIRSEAQTAAAVLGQNFPNSDWYKDAFNLLQSQGLEPSASSESWITQAWNQIKPF
ncbi:MAG: outer membrane protein assembly factor BamD [Hyphomicrobiales bacterium]